MKIIIFSDTHLTQKFDQQKYNFLEEILSSSDQVILAGDFWEGQITTFDKFINSKWKALFPLLKKKKTVYLYGNHDPKELMDIRTNLFSDKQTDEYLFSSGNSKFIVRHGHQDTQKLPILEVLLDNKLLFDLLHSRAEEILVKLFGRNILQVLYSRYNKKIKEGAKLGKNEILITGHTHASEIDLDKNYINTGLIRHGLGQYVVVENGKIKLTEKKY